VTTNRLRSRFLAFLVGIMLVAPVGGRADAADSPVTRVTTLFGITVDDLPPPPVTVIVSRIVFTPGTGDEGEFLAGPRLILVESGHVGFVASGSISVVHTGIGSAVANTTPIATATPTPVPTPTPLRSPTTDVILGPGDGVPVPIWTMHSLKNAGTEPAVIIDVRVAGADAPAPPANLDVETLATESGLTALPDHRVTILLGHGTTAAGGMVLPPPTGDYQLVAPASGAGRLERAAEGSVRNMGASATDVYVVTIARAGAIGPWQPPQPAMGPGGAEVAFDRAVSTHYGPDEQGYWLDEPADPHPGSTLPTTGPFPVVLFLGGCCVTDAEPYFSAPPDEVQLWLDHLTQRGAIVLYPILRGEHAQEDIAAAMRGAMAELEKGGHAQADWGRFAVIGFSFGGWNAPVYAGLAASEGLPVPQAILSTVAYDAGTTPDLSAIPASTRIVLVVGGDDFEWGDRGARRIWAALTTVPADHRSFVRLVTDRYGIPNLDADHVAPATANYGLLDAIDWYGTWKLGDAVMSCSFAGRDCAYAFGDTPEERFMGYWSDGVPVAELEVVTDPGPPDPATPSATP
jgi:hypothetical protein